MNVRSILLLSILATLSLVASGAQSAIYRCAQGNGAVLYSDNPCDGGSIVDLHPGKADPKAEERLAQARAELDRAAADRRAQAELEARREAMRREAQATQQYAPEPPASPEGYYGTAYDGLYAPYVPSDRMRDGARHGVSPRVKHTDRRVPQVVRVPHPPR